MAMNREDFFKELRKDHQEIRCLLFEMISAFGNKDFLKSGTLLRSLDILIGPHFRYEEESVYPALIQVYGAEYISKLLTDHDLAIARAKKLNSMINRGSKENEDITECIKTVKSILPHVSDCECLAHKIEKFENGIIKTICDSMENARKENLPLIEWSDTVRNRKPLQII